MDAQQKLFFEDYTVGRRESFGRYEVTEQEVVDFASRYDPQPYHVDREAARHSLFGALCASGWHTCAMTMRMMVDHMNAVGTASLGSPGLDELRWLLPVFPGDVLRVESEILEARPLRSRGAMGVVKIRYTVLNQKDEAVLRFVGNSFVARRPAAVGAADDARSATCG